MSGGANDLEEGSMNGYCMKCRSEKTIVEPRTVVMKNGRYATEGKCPSCGTRLFRLGREKAGVEG
jgi:hypothetical protein